MATTTYAVQGMTCDHCVAAVTKAVTGIDGVTAASVDLDAGTVAITSESDLDRVAVAEAVDEAGYDLA